MGRAEQEAGHWPLFHVSVLHPDLAFCAFLFVCVFKICFEAKIVIVWRPQFVVSACVKCTEECCVSACSICNAAVTCLWRLWFLGADQTPSSREGWGREEQLCGGGEGTVGGWRCPCSPLPRGGEGQARKKLARTRSAVLQVRKTETSNKQ